MTEYITPDISPLLVRNVSSVYSDPVRVFMEYIDNSLDACEDHYVSKRNAYRIKVKIEIEIQGNTNSAENLKVVFRDNCGGIKSLQEILSNIGNSTKKDQPWLNGQFGYGIYSFLAICNKMEIITRCKRRNQAVVITSADFSKEKLAEVKLHLKHEGSVELNSDGTTVILSGFDESMIGKLQAESLAKEIESHFELLLSRDQLEIKIMQGESVRICEPFDYASFEGGEYRTTISLPSVNGSHANSHCEIYLKFTKGRALNRCPVFVSRKRRISSVKDLKIFDTDCKSSIWGHPNITGYIDTGNLLTPALSRKDYKNSKEIKVLFKLIRKKQPEIEAFVKENFEASSPTDFSALEKRLIGVFKAVIKSQHDNSTGSNNDFQIALRSDEEGSLDMLTKSQGSSGSNVDSRPRVREVTLNGIRDSHSTYSSRKNQRKHGVGLLMIRIDGVNEPPKGADMVPKRSVLIDHCVVIYKKHADFQSRIDRSRIGYERISSGLCIYIIAEFLFHYQSAYCEFSESEEENKEELILSRYIGQLYLAEAGLRSIIGKSLSNLS